MWVNPAFYAFHCFVRPSDLCVLGKMAGSSLFDPEQSGSLLSQTLCMSVAQPVCLCPKHNTQLVHIAHANNDLIDYDKFNQYVRFLPQYITRLNEHMK